MVNIYIEVDRLLKAGQKLVLARIIRQVGSAPRGLGTGFIIRPEGSFAGTIGGGSLEYRVLQKAREVFQHKKSVLLNFKLTGREVAESEMLCGGIADVFLEPVFPENSVAVDVFGKAAELLHRGRRAVLLTRVAEGLKAGDMNCRLLVDENGAVVGSLGDRVELEPSRLEKWRALKRPVLQQPGADKSGPQIFIEPVAPDTVLYLFGAGHISTFVAALAGMLGFRVVVIDDRKDFASRERFPGADELIVCPFNEAFHRISITPSSFVGIITRGHRYDKEVLKAALETEAAYIGMIGSRRKRNIIYQALTAEGISEDALTRVHAPIGLDIGAQTPEEIAVSIVAELIEHRAGSPGKEPG